MSTELVLPRLTLNRPAAPAPESELSHKPSSMGLEPGAPEPSSIGVLERAAPAAPEPVPAPLPELVPAPPRADLVGAWLAGKKPVTVAGYQLDLGHFARFAQQPSGGAAVEALLAMGPGPANELVLAYRNDQLGRGLSSATISRRLAAVRSVVKLARQLGRVAWAVEVSAPPAEARRDMRGPDADGLKKIRRALKTASKRDRAIFYLLFSLGLRRAEATGLDLIDVDFKGGRLFVLGKGRREKVGLVFGEDLARALADWVSVRGPEPGPLFFREDGPNRGRGRLNVGSVNRVMKAIGEAAGLAGPLRPHGARHAAITELFRRKKTVAEVMGFSRHKRPETVMRYNDELRANGADMARELGKVLS